MPRQTAHSASETAGVKCVSGPLWFVHGHLWLFEMDQIKGEQNRMKDRLAKI